MVPTTDAISEQISSLSDDFAERLSSIAGRDGNMRTAVLKSGLREIVWAVAERFADDKQEMAEMLSLMSDLVREHNGAEASE